MKHNNPTRFEDRMADVPRISWAHTPTSTATERELTAWFGIGFLTCAALAFLVVALLTSNGHAIDPRYDPCDVNRDGKVSATDLLIVKRHILGLDAGGVEYETTQSEVTP